MRPWYPSLSALSVAAALAFAPAGAGCSDDSAAGGSDAAEDIAADAVEDATDDAAPTDADDPDGGGDAPDGSQTDDVPADTGPAPQVCPPGLAGCVEGDLLVCNEAGSAFVIEACDEGLVCAEGACVECATDADCDAGRACLEAVCVVPPLEVLTQAVPSATEGVGYSFQLEAAGGEPPYGWKRLEGSFPAGLGLSDSGELAGVAEGVGTWPFIVEVTDQAGGVATAPLSLKVVDSGLNILTPSPLPLATDGEPYSLTFEAAGGDPPYFWGLSAGTLPAGLSLSGDGVVAGLPSGDGSFEFTVKVFDNATPPRVATGDFSLPVTIAPLEIVGAQEIDLFITKLIVLPLIIVVDGIPIPYNAQLEATGGKKPHHWSEDAFPGFVQSLIPQSGIPQGLTLSDNGSLSGAVTDPSLAVTITIPFTQIDLSGFFFAARVEDDQPVPFDASALYIIPTVPIGGN